LEDDLAADADVRLDRLRCPAWGWRAVVGRLPASSSLFGSGFHGTVESVWAPSTTLCHRADQPPQRLPTPPASPAAPALSTLRSPSCVRVLLPRVVLATQTRPPRTHLGGGDLRFLGSRPRRMDKLVASLGITSVSKSQVSQMATAPDLPPLPRRRPARQA